MHKKIILGIFIIALGGMTSLYIVGSAEEPNLNLETFLSANFLENIQQDLIFQNIARDSSGNPVALDLPENHNNLTDLLANAYARHLVREAPDLVEGLEGGERVVLPAFDIHEVIDETFEQRAVGIVRDFRANKFSAENLTISPNNSREAHEKYLKKVGEAFNKNFSNTNTGLDGSMIIEWMRTEDPTDIMRQERAATRFVNELKGMEVPPDWTKFHLGSMNLWHKQSAILGALPGVNEDPFKTLAALSSVPFLVEDIEKFAEDLMEIVEKVSAK